MRGKRFTLGEIEKTIRLRETGHSLNEISRILNRAKSVVYPHITKVKILPEYLGEYAGKQGGSKKRSERMWSQSEDSVSKFKLSIDRKEKLLILASLYWAEGTKREFNILDSDPALISVFVNCLEELGVARDRLLVTVRTYEDLDKNVVIDFWSKLLKVDRKVIRNVNILKGKKKGKLKYGMCRIRVRKGDPYFKIIMSMIGLISKELSDIKVQIGPRSSMDRTAHS